jgi:hypothetical protein
MARIVSASAEMVKAGRLYATVEKTAVLDDGRVVTYRVVPDDRAADLVLALPDTIVAQVVRQSVNQALRNAAIAAAADLDKRLRDAYESLKTLRPDLSFEAFKASVLK